jgi:hypothetical protein
MKRRFYNAKVDPTNKLEWAKFLMDLNLMLDDLTGFCDYMQHLPTYANNAAAVAAFLPVGQPYKTATGEVRVVV